MTSQNDPVFSHSAAAETPGDAGESAPGKNEETGENEKEAAEKEAAAAKSDLANGTTKADGEEPMKITTVGASRPAPPVQRTFTHFRPNPVHTPAQPPKKLALPGEKEALFVS